MSMERIIGIDFGTSTSVIRVKRYQDGKPLGERLDVKEVTFNSMGQSLVPTLIQKVQDGAPYYGYEAQKAHKKSTFFQNFKIDLESPDLEKRNQARSLTEDFFTYMAKQYRDQSSGGFFGEFGDTEKTLVSYPVKWSEETRAFMLEAARKAGFPNVEGMDEAQAAITAVMAQGAAQLSKKGYLYDGVPVNILMADMGAGTTDLVLCRCTPGKNSGYEVLSVWPKDGNTFFGGGEMEVLLQDYLHSKLPEEDADTVMKRCGLDKFKSWKETMVSPALMRNETVSEFSEFDNWVEGLEIDAKDYDLNRAEFERLAGDYLKGFPKLVNGCLKDAGITGGDVDLVLLTGGHSQWYFVKEQLKGALNQCGKVELGKIKADSERIIPVPRPQETVALGLVYSPLMREREDCPKTNEVCIEKVARQNLKVEIDQLKCKTIERIIIEFYDGFYEEIDLEGFEISTKHWIYVGSKILEAVHECDFELREKLFRYKKNWTGMNLKLRVEAMLQKVNACRKDMQENGIVFNPIILNDKKVDDFISELTVVLMSEEIIPVVILSFDDINRIVTKLSKEAMAVMVLNSTNFMMYGKIKNVLDTAIKNDVVSASKEKMDNGRARIINKLSQRYTEIFDRMIKNMIQF